MQMGRIHISHLNLENVDCLSVCMCAYCIFYKNLKPTTKPSVKKRQQLDDPANRLVSADCCMMTGRPRIINYRICQTPKAN